MLDRDDDDGIDADPVVGADGPFGFESVETVSNTMRWPMKSVLFFNIAKETESSSRNRISAHL